jgi:glycosyltransferase involved in cell wall biosynthesis
MRFCMITTFYPPYHCGGDAICVRALARALVARGHEVEVVHCDNAYRLQRPEAPATTPEHDGVVVHRLRSRLGWLSPVITQQAGHPGVKARQLRAVFEQHFDVVNFHNVSLIGGPGVLGMSHAPVNLYTLHEHWLLCPTHTFWKNGRQACDRPQCLRCCVRSGIPPQLWRYTGLVEQSLGHVDALLSPSHYTATRHRAAGFAPPIHVLPLFTDLDDHTGAPSDPPRRPCFLFVGRVTASKGIVPLLKEFSTLPDYDLWIVGDGDLRPTLERDYAPHPHIRFAGALPHHELVAMYRQATALVLPSLAPEVFPLTILEAFACGTPAIVHHSGGSREAVETTGGGIVYDSASELRAALRSLAVNADFRELLAQRARAGYEQHYTRDHYLDRYLDVIKTIAEKKRRLVH